MKKFLKVASVLLLLASFIGCDQTTLPGGEKPGDKTGQIVGVAQFENKTNHEGINITLVATSGLLEANYCASRGIEFAARAITVDTTTDEKGNYKFENVEPGTYTIYASADASSEKAVLTKVEVRAGETASPAVLKLNPTGNIKGSVTIDGKTEGVLGCEVFIGGTNYSAKVASSGAFLISDVPVLAEDAPIYELYVQKGDYIQPIPYEGKVEADKTLEVGTIDLLSSNWSVDCTNQISRCEATEEGIKFVGNLLSNVTPSDSTSQCIIQVTNIDTGVVMKKNYSVSSNTWEEWNFVYPLVEKDKEYKFVVEMRWNSSLICAKEFTVTAIGGLGEYIVENADKVEILFDKDSKIISRTEQKFTDNKNIPILEYGTVYTLYSNSDNAANLWDGEWLMESAISELTGEQEYDLTKINEISGWRQYEYLERALQGRQLGVQTVTYAKLAKYDYNGTATFYFNDYKIEFFDWDGLESKKAFIMYGISLPQNDESEPSVHFFKDIPGVEEKYILETEDGLKFVEKDTPNAKPVYGKVFDYGTTIPVPAYIPDFSEVPLDEVYKKALSFYKFTGEWIGEIAYSDYILPFYSPNLINNDNAKLIDNLYVPILMVPQMEQYRASAEFYDEDKTLIESIVCTKNNGSFVLTLPIPPAKENMVGYWVDEYGNEIRNQSVNLYEGNENKFYLKYKERVFSSDELYYLELNSLKSLYFDIEAGKSYKITWADSYEGSSDVLSLINEKGISSTELCDVKVFAFDDSGRYYIENGDSGFNSPVYITPSVSGKLTVEISPWSSNGKGYFALSVKEVDEGDKEPEAPAFDGNVDLTKLAEYDETAGGLVKDFGKAVNGYDVAFTYKLSDLGYTDEDFTTIVVVADVYNGESKYDLASDWAARLMLRINQTVEVYNSGVDDATLGIKFESKDDVLDIHVKDEPVTKVVVKAIKFVK